MNALPQPSADLSILQWITRHIWGVSIGSTLLLHGIAVGMLYAFVESRGEDLVILHYNAYLGIDLLGAWWQLFLVPGVTFVFSLINLLIARMLLSREYPEVAALFFLGNAFLAGAVIVVAIALSYVNV